MHTNILINHSQEKDAMDFQERTLDGLIDSAALVTCLSETDYEKIQQLSSKEIFKEMPPLLKLWVANGDIETPTKTIMLQFEISRKHSSSLNE